MSEALLPPVARPAITRPGWAVVLPAVIVDAGPAAVERFLEFFAARIANARTRAAYGRAVGQFLALGRVGRSGSASSVNCHFYPARPLCSHPSVRCSDSSFPFSKAALLYVDTAPFRPWASRPAPGKFSHYNPFHALLARNVVLRLAETGFLPPADGRTTPSASLPRTGLRRGT